MVSKGKAQYHTSFTNQVASGNEKGAKVLTVFLKGQGGAEAQIPRVWPQTPGSSLGGGWLAWL